MWPLGYSQSTEALAHAAAVMTAIHFWEKALAYSAYMMTKDIGLVLICLWSCCKLHRVGSTFRDTVWSKMVLPRPHKMSAEEEAKAQLEKAKGHI